VARQHSLNDQGKNSSHYHKEDDDEYDEGTANDAHLVGEKQCDEDQGAGRGEGRRGAKVPVVLFMEKTQ
jgi:hypothetical protein